MSFKLRPYQRELKEAIYREWNAGHKNVLAVMPTGGGKTKTFCEIAREMAIDPAGPRLPTAIMVHRKELVQQISLTLAEQGIIHNIIAPKEVIKACVTLHRQETKRQFYNYQAPITVLSVDTLNARILRHEKWAETIRFWITDEATHLLKENKWGQAVANFPNAIGLGVTATPQRLDKKGLGSHVDGVFDVMVQGPTTRWLIDQGFLSKYKVVIPDNDYEVFLKKPSETGDYSTKAMREAAEHSHIVGDVVKNYRKHADGKQAIVFASDIHTGYKIEDQFRGAGITAKLLTSDTPNGERTQSLADFRQKKIKVLINVDLFDEGLDVPGIEAVIMARPTASLSKYLQMCGRGLRVMEGKPYMILIDHVGNWRRHQLPDNIRKWTLDRIIKRGDRINFMRVCENIDCNSPYDRALTHCPLCGTEFIPGRRAVAEGGGRIPPSMVDGDMMLIDPETIREMEAKANLLTPDQVSQKVLQATGNIGATKKADNDRLERFKFRDEVLREKIALWAGMLKRHGVSDRSIHKEFYIRFSKTITEALGEPTEEMKTLVSDIESEMKYGYRYR